MDQSRNSKAQEDQESTTKREDKGTRLKETRVVPETKKLKLHRRLGIIPNDSDRKFSDWTMIIRH